MFKNMCCQKHLPVNQLDIFWYCTLMIPLFILLKRPIIGSFLNVLLRDTIVSKHLHKYGLFERTFKRKPPLSENNMAAQFLVAK